MKATVRPLSELRSGERGVVQAAALSDRSLGRRLEEMGLTEGAVVTVRPAAPLGDPVRIQLRGYELALRRESAAEIFLRPGESPPPGTDPAPAFHAAPVSRAAGRRTPVIALIGNPNCGKTTLFNAFTGSDRYVGNWPGVTVEKKEGVLRRQERAVTVTDLPGIYALSAWSAEERVVSDYLRTEAPDVIVNVADAAHLERSLYLTLELLALGRPMVLALNCIDEVERQGAFVDTAALSRSLGVPVAAVSARERRGLEDLLDKATAQISKGRISRPVLPEGPAARYRYIHTLTGQVTGGMGEERTERIDRLLLSRILALPLFFLLMLGVFSVTFGPLGSGMSRAVTVLLEEVLSPMVRQGLAAAGAAPWAASLAVDGILGGVGSVLSFLPQLAVLFFCLSLLEDSGYMARAAFLMDGFLRRLGLSGKAFIPMLLGLGCTVPAVLAARTMDSGRDRLLTILLLPFLSCSARLPVYGLIAGAFFPAWSGPAVFSLYVLGLLLGLLTGYLLRHTLLKGGGTPFLMELPSYRLPRPGDLLRHVWERLRGFLVKAGTLLLTVSVALWFLRSFGPGFRPISEGEASLLTLLGGVLAPCLRPLGFGSWQAAVALIAGLMAKEAVASSLYLLCRLSPLDGGGAAAAALSGLFTPASACAFLVFVLLYVPCAAAVAAIARETRSLRWTLFSVLWQLMTAWCVSFVVYRVARLLLGG